MKGSDPQASNPSFVGNSTTSCGMISYTLCIIFCFPLRSSHFLSKWSWSGDHFISIFTLGPLYSRDWKPTTLKYKICDCRKRIGKIYIHFAQKLESLRDEGSEDEWNLDMESLSVSLWIMFHGLMEVRWGPPIWYRSGLTSIRS